ncbi:hypothetical protein MD535_13105 [Vibrio sp. ZSDZ65]|uniref:Uncharacterized protein n=1 Tax=Vibrio qingdaonensis TaxID=2829491 RepID=A0A9X3CPC1_9VIBR|nr:hypothetical protein [Vibrio qingdaonensis]MCW8346936.1 hypothetical protein [Vibrio qingdaonensis]
MKINITLLATLASLSTSAAFADTIWIEDYLGEDIKIYDGTNHIKPYTNANGRIGYSFRPTASNVKMIIGQEEYQMLTSRGTYAPYGCNYTFMFSEDGKYQSNGGNCTSLFDSPPERIVLQNDSLNDIYPAFDAGWGYAADSIFGFLKKEQSQLYTPNNKFLSSIGILYGNTIKQVGFYDQTTTEYVTCSENLVFSGVTQFKYIFDEKTRQGQCEQF